MNKGRDSLINFLEDKNIKYVLDSDGEITEIKGRLDLTEFDYPFNAPRLEVVEGAIYLTGYKHDFNAPNLKAIKYLLRMQDGQTMGEAGGESIAEVMEVYIDMVTIDYMCGWRRGFPMPGVYDFKTPPEKPPLGALEGCLHLEGYRHRINVPSLEIIEGHLNLCTYPHPFDTPNLKKVDKGVHLQGYEFPFNTSNLEGRVLYIDLRGYRHSFDMSRLTKVRHINLDSGTYNFYGWEYTLINVDDMSLILLSEEVNEEGFTIKTCIEPRFIDGKVKGETRYVVSKDGVEVSERTFGDAMEEYERKRKVKDMNKGRDSLINFLEDMDIE
jgi:hypothetical protein